MKERDTTKPKAFAFVLMPFGEAFDDIYELGIKEACKEAGAYCERVDEQMFDENILQRIYNQISKADLIIADLSTRNANVFYETGYAHALGKRVILLTQKADDIPFDLKHFSHLLYDGRITKLKKMLTTRVKWCIDNPLRPISITDIPLELFIDGETVTEATLEIKGTDFKFDLDLHNIGNAVIKPNSFRIGLFFKPHLNVVCTARMRKIRNAHGVDFYHIEPTNDIFPDAWETITLEVPNKAQKESKGTGFIRLYTEVGTKDFDFKYTKHAVVQRSEGTH